MNSPRPRDRRLRVVVLPNKPWKPYLDDFRPGEGPDPDRLRRLLADRGIDLIVVDPFAPPWNPFGRAHPLFAGLDPLRSLLVLLRYRSVDLVISVFESGAVVLLLLRRLLLFRPAIALWDVSVGSTWRPRRMVLGFVLPRIDRLFGLTRWQKAAAERQYHLRVPADVVGYAVDEAFYHPDFNRESDTILSVGEDIARDYATLVEAVRTLPVSVVIKTSRSLDLPADGAASVTIIRDHLSALALRDLYARASVVVVPLRPSDNPSGITSLFEAMAMGKPIIASDIPMVREFITSGENGVIVPVGDPAALRDAITRLLVAPDERHRLGRNARAFLEADLTMASLADRYAACVRAAVGRGA